MFEKVSSPEAHNILQKSIDVVLIDVRSSMEYEYVGHPVGSIHIPIKESPGWEILPNFIDNVKSELMKKFPDTNDLFSIQILLICRSGRRSGEAALLLESEGYKNTINIVDGFEGDKDVNGHRNVINGWRFNKLPWKQD